MKLNNKIKNIIEEAIKEDIGEGDITSEALIPNNCYVKAAILTKEKCIVCGLDIAKYIFEKNNVRFKKLFQDGDEVKKGDTLATIEGDAKEILKLERVCLNFLQRLSGIATLTKKFVDKTKSKNIKIFDTRKTTPNLRVLEKYAVRIGGGCNHRVSLSDSILIKDNHIKIVGDVKKAIELAKKNAKGKKIEVEVKTLKELKRALEASPDIIMLDNMNNNTLNKVIKYMRKYDNIKVEVSGGINLNNIKRLVNKNINSISIGALTHSYKSIDMKLEVYPIKHVG